MRHDSSAMKQTDQIDIEKYRVLNGTKKKGEQKPLEKQKHTK